MVSHHGQPWSPDGHSFTSLKLTVPPRVGVLVPGLEVQQAADEDKNDETQCVPQQAQSKIGPKETPHARQGSEQVLRVGRWGGGQRGPPMPPPPSLAIDMNPQTERNASYAGGIFLPPEFSWLLTTSTSCIELRGEDGVSTATAQHPHPHAPPPPHTPPTPHPPSHRLHRDPYDRETAHEQIQVIFILPFPILESLPHFL